MLVKIMRLVSLLKGMLSLIFKGENLDERVEKKTAASSSQTTFLGREKALKQLFSVEKKLSNSFSSTRKSSQATCFAREKLRVWSQGGKIAANPVLIFSQYLVLDVTQSLSNECWFGKTLSSTQMEVLSICLFLHSGQPLSFQSLPLLPSHMFHLFILF